jgi:SAM-dependent methyltransferase
VERPAGGSVEEILFAAHHALEEQHWWFRARRRAIVGLGRTLVPEGGCIVDVGCGTGADVAAFPPSYDRHGLDRSASAIEFARRRHPGISFAAADLPDSGGDVISGADLVLLCDVLEHVEQDDVLLRWLIGALKPGAHLLLTVPADPRLWSPHDETYGHHRRYTRETLTGLWAGEPVEVRLLSPFNRLLYPVARAVRGVATKRGRGWGRANSDLALPWPPVNWFMEHAFALEIPALKRALGSARRMKRGAGVSLIAVLRRVE